MSLLQTALMIIQVFCCFFMTGLIWLVQIVHYPSFDFVDESQFTTFHDFHARRITWIVLPIMGLELASAVFLCLNQDPLFIVNLVLVLALWMITALISVPLHEKLGQKKDPSQIKKIVLTNWLRVVIWTLRSIVFVYLLHAPAFIQM